MRADDALLVSVPHWPWHELQRDFEKEESLNFVDEFGGLGTATEKGKIPIRANCQSSMRSSVQNFVWNLCLDRESQTLRAFLPFEQTA